MYSVISIRTCMGNGACTESGFIGEDTAGDTLLHTQEHGADHAAGGCSWGESTAEYFAEYSGYMFNVHDNNAQSQNHI